MERSIFAALIGGLLGITALGGLAFVGSAPGSPSALPSRPEGEWRLLDPVVYENISIFPVVSSQGQDTSPFLTLEEGLATGEVTVAEQGAQILQRSRDGRPIYPPQYNTGASVNQLVLINRSRRPLLLLAGELVSGGKQDRVIGKDRIVPVGAPPLPLDVVCAAPVQRRAICRREYHRPSQRPRESGRRSEASGSLGRRPQRHHG